MTLEEKIEDQLISLGQQADAIVRLQAERDQWRARCIALFWSGNADNKTAGEVRKAAEEIERLFSSDRSK